MKSKPKCRHRDEDVESFLPVEWCSVCGAIRIMVAGKLGKWIKPLFSFPQCSSIADR